MITFIIIIISYISRSSYKFQLLQYCIYTQYILSYVYIIINVILLYVYICICTKFYSLVYRIRQIFQNLGTALNISTGEEVTLIGANYLLNVQQVNTSQPMFTGFERLYNQTSNTSVAQTGGGGDGIPEAVMVSIPAAVFRQVSQQMNQTDVRVVVVRYGNTRLFTDTQSMRAVTSSVLSVSFGIRLTNLSSADSIRLDFAKSQVSM